jgi:hypothetical protein
MDAKETIFEPQRILASVRTFHLAFREGETVFPIHSPTFLRIRKLLFTDCIIGHKFPDRRPASIMPCCGKPAQAASSEGFPKNADKVIILTIWRERTGVGDRMTPVENPNPRLRVVLPCPFTRRISSPPSSLHEKFSNRFSALLEATPIRMATNDARAKGDRILATFGVFHQTFPEIERLPQIPGPTFFRIRKTPLIADRVVGHDRRNSIPAMPSRASPPACPRQFLP